MTIEAVVFDWGGTLSEFVNLELVDARSLAARHIDPDHEDEMVSRKLPPPWPGHRCAHQHPDA